jgi:hypothetical protein
MLHRVIYPPVAALGSGTKQLCSNPAAATFLLLYAMLLAVAVIPLQVGRLALRGWRAAACAAV